MWMKAQGTLCLRQENNLRKYQGLHVKVLIYYNSTIMTSDVLRYDARWGEAEKEHGEGAPSKGGEGGGEKREGRSLSLSLYIYIYTYV